MALELLDGLWKNTQSGLLVLLSVERMEKGFDSDPKAVVLDRCVRQAAGLQSERITFEAVVEIVYGDYKALTSSMTLTSVLPKRLESILIIKGYSYGSGRTELWKIKGLVV